MNCGSVASQGIALLQASAVGEGVSSCGFGLALSHACMHHVWRLAGRLCLMPLILKIATQF